MNIYPSKEQLLQGEGTELLQPIGCQLPSDTLTPVSAFLRLRQSGARQAFLLESAEGGESVGRYSFIGIDPFARLKSRSGKTSFHHFEHQEQHELTTNFGSVEACLNRYQTKPLPGFPSFRGGAVGYVAYDSVRFIEDLPHPDSGIGSDDINLLLFKTVIAFDRLKHRLFFVTHLDGAKPLEAQYDPAIAYLQKLKERLYQPCAEESLDAGASDFQELEPIEAAAEMGRERFCAAVKTIKKHIRNGDIFQCVLSDRFSFPYDGDPFLVYRMIRMINPSPYLFYLALGDDEFLLGSSPEMLVRTTGKLVETCPIAGTRPRGASPEEDKKREADLLASVKERAEHIMLVDLGRNDIGRIARPGSVRVSEFMKVERYSHVMHLVSLVEGKMKSGVSPWQALGSCFPAGTLSGAPKIRAMEIIARLEGQQRGPYGGAVVAHDFSGDLNTCITIRSLYLKGGKGYIQAGAGVVADSRPDKEYDEVLNKAKAVRTAVSAALSISGGGR